MASGQERFYNGDGSNGYAFESSRLPSVKGEIDTETKQQPREHPNVSGVVGDAVRSGSIIDGVSTAPNTSASRDDESEFEWACSRVFEPTFPKPVGQTRQHPSARSA